MRRNNKNLTRNYVIEKQYKESSWFLEKINKIDRPLDQLRKRKSEQVKINSNGDESGNIPTDKEKIQTII